MLNPLGGGAGVLLQKPRSRREIYNDIDDELYNLFLVARDHGYELKEKLMITPMSRKEYMEAYKPTDISLERARRTLVKSYFGIGDSIKDNRKTGMRASSSSNTAVEKSWVNYSECFEEIIERLKGIVLENLDYRKVIEKYDSSETFFYLDPPYVKATRSEKHAYRHDFSDADQKIFLETLKGIKGMVIVSGYEHPMYAGLEWTKIQAKFKTQRPTFKTETLWLCPKTISRQKQMTLC